jgi:hypothetical protein
MYEVDFPLTIFFSLAVGGLRPDAVPAGGERQHGHAIIRVFPQA